jgi:hypothetical protein
MLHEINPNDYLFSQNTIKFGKISLTSELPKNYSLGAGIHCIASPQTASLMQEFLKAGIGNFND